MEGETEEVCWEELSGLRGWIVRGERGGSGGGGKGVYSYLIFVICFTRAKFLENKIYTEKTRKLRQNTQ